MFTLEYCSQNGVIVETDEGIYIFDYTQGTLPSHYLLSKKRKLFLVSRNDAQHYTAALPNYKLPIVASYDFQSMGLHDAWILKAHDTLHFGSVKISALPTTRRGLCYVLEEREKTIFFGGDFNLWHWPNLFNEDQVHEEFLKYYAILKEIQALAPFDLALSCVNPMMPVDTDRGARELIQMIKPRVFMPIGFQEHQRIETFGMWGQSLSDTRVVIPKGENTVFNLE